MIDLDHSGQFSNTSNKKDKKKNKKKKEDLIIELKRRNEELENQLSLKQDILARTDKKNSILFDENKLIKEEKATLQHQIEEALIRLKELGGKISTEKIQLSPAEKAAKIGEQWNSLYQHEWTAAYEELCMHDTGEKSHRGPEKRLMEITEWCYKKCCDLAREQMDKIDPLLSDIAYHLHLQLPSQAKDPSVIQVSNSLESLRSHIRQRQHDSELVETVKQRCVADFKSTHTDICKCEEKYVSKCSEVCWLMRICDPPMVIEYQNLEGTKLNATKFIQYNLEGTVIELVVWPDLLLHENGPIVSKGIVRTFSDIEESIYDVPKNGCKIENGNGAHIQLSAVQKEGHSNDMKIEDTSRGPRKVDDTYMTMRSTNPVGNDRYNPFDREEPRPNTQYIDRAKAPNVSYLSKSDKFTCSLDIYDDKQNSGNDKGVIQGNKRKPNETFVSYLNTNSSTM